MHFIVFLLLSVVGQAKPVVGLPLQWINCSTWTDQLSIESVEATMWPPERSKLLTVSVSGTARESFLYGQYNKTIVYRGYALPSIFGPLSDLGIELPSRPGPLTFTIFNSTLPNVAPPGQYDFYIQAREQDQAEIFCVKLSWELSINSL